MIFFRKNSIDRRIILFVLVFQFKGIFAFGQFQNLPLITVIGEAYEYTEPDQVILKVKLSKPLNSAQLQNSRIYNLFDAEETQIRFIESDKEALIENMILIQNRKQVELVKEFFIFINDITKYPDILSRLFNSGFDHVTIWDIRSNKVPQLREKTLIQAIADGRGKADHISQTLGQPLGKVHTIEEIPQPLINTFLPVLLNPADSLTRMGVELYRITPGTLLVSAKVKISFDLIK